MRPGQRNPDLSADLQKTCIAALWDECTHVNRCPRHSWMDMYKYGVRCGQRQIQYLQLNPNPDSTPEAAADLHQQDQPADATLTATQLFHNTIIFSLLSFSPNPPPLPSSEALPHRSTLHSSQDGYRHQVCHPRSMQGRQTQVPPGFNLSSLGST